MPPPAVPLRQPTGTNDVMNTYDRDAQLERRQIHEISMNVARRLFALLERPPPVSPAVSAEIAAGSGTIAGIQHEIDHLMSRLPEGQLLDMSVLTHILESQNRALSLIEDLEAKASRGIFDSRPDQERTHAALIATAREIEREARLYEEEEFGHPLDAPYSLPETHPAQIARRFADPTRVQQPPPQNIARSPKHGAPQPAPRTTRTDGTAAASRRQPPAPRPPAQQRPRKAKPQPRIAPAALFAKARTLATSPVGATTLVAGVAILAASLAGAVSLALSTDSDQLTASSRVPGQKFDGRLSRADAQPTSGSGTLVVSPPANLANLTQPYLVVIATRQSTEELEKDFRYFKETYPNLLGSARGRVDSVQSQDGKTWYRLSLIPPRAQGEASELCTELKSAGLTECWIKPLPIGPASG